jgi:hypothetical protein
MPRDWETIFRNWTKPSSDTECEMQERAERMIRQAIDQYEPLAKRDIKIIPQGSYRNNTNVKQESDIDICVCCMEPFYADYTFADFKQEETGNVDSGYNYSQLKNDVGVALLAKFGKDGFRRGDKAFRVHENTARVHADVVAAFAHRRYQKRQLSPLGLSYIYPYIEPEGTQFFPDSGGGRIINWPEQHYANGVARNKATGNRFKWTVRALKNLKYEMEAKGNAAQSKAAKEAPSYLIECLVYNVPNLGDGTPREMVRNAISYCYHATKTDDTCKEFEEVNGLKWLLRGGQPWTREQANSFLLHAWQYGEFS